MKIIFVTLLVSASAQSAPAQSAPHGAATKCAGADTVNADGSCLRARAFKSHSLSKEPTLVVALHGDAPFSKPSYQYRFAELIAARSPNTVAVGLLRPGYTDAEDRRSEGVRGDAVGDSYDESRIAVIAAAIRSLRRRYATRRVVLAGHSGGAAIAAKLIALHPKLVQHAVLVSCPCDLRRWRADMFKASGYEGFKGELSVRSPIDLVAQIPESTRVDVLVGAADPVTKPELSRAYADALKRLDKPFRFSTLNGEHEIFLTEDVLSAVAAAASTSE